jgi:predicted NAD/FAD-binding protein
VAIKNIAIIGSGVSGLGCAWFLRDEVGFTVFEADAHVGGHAHTVMVPEGNRMLPIDTGFMVFNHVTYPNLLRLFRTLDVPMEATDMSFSVHHGPRRLEYRGTSLNHLFAQRRNLLRPGFYRLLAQIHRFNREAVAALQDGTADQLTLDRYVEARGYGRDFLDLYLLPMSSAVWSTPPADMLRFPAASLLRFFHNHGFLGLHTQHPWWTITGGSREYVDRLCAGFRSRILTRTPVRAVRRSAEGVELTTDAGRQAFDAVIFACHPPTTLALLGAGASPEERELLGAFKYAPNMATLHCDPRVMPARGLAWSAWNYRIEGRPGAAGDRIADLRVSTHYWMNRLQGVSDRRNYFVSINGDDLVAPETVIRRIACEHPLFDLAARRAQAGIAALNQQGGTTTRTFFAGAWQGYGFHEDGIRSAVELCRSLLHRDPWRPAPVLELA